MKLGEKIRKLRKSKDLSIDQLVTKTGLSKGMISQIERDMTCPSVTSLWKISKALNVTMNYFFDEFEEYNPIVRKCERKRLTLFNNFRTYELLCPDLKKNIEMLWIIIKPGEYNTDDLIVHDGEECGVVIQGSLRVVYGEKTYDLEEGDSIYLDSTTPHRYINVSDVESISVWAMVPPSF